MIKVFSNNYVYIIRELGAAYIKSEQSLKAPPFYSEDDGYPSDVIASLRHDSSVLFVFESNNGLCDEEAYIRDWFKMRVSISENPESTLFSNDIPHGELTLFYKDTMVFNQSYSAPDDLVLIDGNGWYDMVGHICDDIINYLNKIALYDYSFIEDKKRAFIDFVPPEKIGYREVIRALQLQCNLKPIPVRNLKNEPFLIKDLSNTLLIWETPLSKDIYLEIKCLDSFNEANFEQIRIYYTGVHAFRCEDGSWSIRYCFGNQVNRVSLQHELCYHVSRMIDLWHLLNDNCLDPIMSMDWEEAYFINEVIMLDRKIGELGLEICQEYTNQRRPRII